MSKHNYSQYSNKNNNRKNNDTAKPKVERPVEKPKVEDKPNIEAPEVKLVAETVETVALPETVTGVVSGCAKLNVRAEPTITSDIVCVLDAMSEIEIDISKSNHEWFKICTAIGAEGYCMRKFIDAYL